MEFKPMYTLKEVEEIIKVSQRTIYTYIENGTLKAVKVGGRWKVTEEALKEFLHIETKEN